MGGIFRSLVGFFSVVLAVSVIPGNALSAGNVMIDYVSGRIVDIRNPGRELGYHQGKIGGTSSQTGTTVNANQQLRIQPQDLGRMARRMIRQNAAGLLTNAGLAGLEQAQQAMMDWNEANGFEQTVDDLIDDQESSFKEPSTPYVTARVYKVIGGSPFSTSPTSNCSNRASSGGHSWNVCNLPQAVDDGTFSVGTIQLSRLEAARNGNCPINFYGLHYNGSLLTSSYCQGGKLDPGDAYSEQHVGDVVKNFTGSAGYQQFLDGAVATGFTPASEQLAQDIMKGTIATIDHLTDEAEFGHPFNDPNHPEYDPDVNWIYGNDDYLPENFVPTWNNPSHPEYDPDVDYQIDNTFDDPNIPSGDPSDPADVPDGIPDGAIVDSEGDPVLDNGEFIFEDGSGGYETADGTPVDPGLIPPDAGISDGVTTIPISPGGSMPGPDHDSDQDNVDLETPTVPGTDPDGVPDTGDDGSVVAELPGFCTWAGVLCDWIGWTQQDFEAPEDPEVPTVDPISEGLESYDLDQADGVCPSPVSIDISAIFGVGETLEFEYTPLCDAAEMAGDLIFFGAGFFSLLIIGRGVK